MEANDVSAFGLASSTPWKLAGIGGLRAPGGEVTQPCPRQSRSPAYEEDLECAQ